MSFLDKMKHKADELGLREKADQLAEEAKKAAAQAREKAGELAAENREKVEGLLDKAGAKIDERTEGRYSDTIAKAKGQVTKGVDKLAEGAGHPTGPAAPGGFEPPPVDEEAVAEEVTANEFDPEAPLDATPVAPVDPDSGRLQQAYDEAGEPIDDLTLDRDAPEAPTR